MERCTFIGRVALIAVLIWCCTAPAAVPTAAQEGALSDDPGRESRFVAVGMGGGGGMFAAASSPHDPNLLFVSCDMGGFYRSADGGRHWQMIDFRQTRGSTRCRPIFHPTDPGVVFMMGKISRDQGRSWRQLASPVPWRNGRRVTAMGIDQENGELLLVATLEGAFVSRDKGASWHWCRGVEGKVVDVYISPQNSQGRRTIFLATEKAVMRSDDDGKTWLEKTAGLPWKELRSMAGAADGRGENITLYVTVPSKVVGGMFAGGVYRSVDLGESWQSVMGSGINTKPGKQDEWGDGDIAQYRIVRCAEGYPRRVYVTCSGTGYWPPYHRTVYRSDDGGENWQYTFNWDLRFRDFNVEPGWQPFAGSWEGGGAHFSSGFSINSRNPDILLYSSNELFLSTDGGRNWRQCYSRYASGQPPPIRTSRRRRPGRWQSIGLEVTTTWNYAVDPFESNRHYICYTDIGFAISTDGGKTWRNNAYSSGTPWVNTTYDLAFDPDVKGLVWAAMSNVHDIPHYVYTNYRRRGPGGVCVSKDSCSTWKVSSKGLPRAPCTSIVLDPTSPKGSRRLFVTMYGKGVYRSTNNGRTWKNASRGLPLERNNHTFLIRRHTDGTLFCSITASRHPGRKYPPGGLFRSMDNGDNWTEITASRPMYWPNGFAVDPRDSNIIYLATANTPAGPAQGGVWKTSDGGKSWKQLLTPDHYDGKAGPEPDIFEGMFVTIPAHDPDSIYVGTTAHGLWISHDRGKSWKQSLGVPFGAIHRVVFDPSRHERVYITTFGGGVWTGPVSALEK